MDQKEKNRSSQSKKNKNEQTKMSIIEKLTIENEALNKILKNVSANSAINNKK